MEKFADDMGDFSLRFTMAVEQRGLKIAKAKAIKSKPWAQKLASKVKNFRGDKNERRASMNEEPEDNLPVEEVKKDENPMMNE